MHSCLGWLQGPTDGFRLWLLGRGAGPAALPHSKVYGSWSAASHSDRINLDVGLPHRDKNAAAHRTAVSSG